MGGNHNCMRDPKYNKILTEEQIYRQLMLNQGLGISMMSSGYGQ